MKNPGGPPQTPQPIHLKEEITKQRNAELESSIQKGKELFIKLEKILEKIPGAHFSDSNGKVVFSAELFHNKNDYGEHIPMFEINTFTNNHQTLNLYKDGKMIDAAYDYFNEKTYVPPITLEETNALLLILTKGKIEFDGQKDTGHTPPPPIEKGD